MRPCSPLATSLLALTASGAFAHSGAHPLHGAQQQPSFATAKLLAPALRRLGVGSIRPAGWLKDELTLQAQGISGQLPYFWHYLNSTEWLDPAARDPYGRARGS